MYDLKDSIVAICGILLIAILIYLSGWVYPIHFTKQQLGIMNEKIDVIIEEEKVKCELIEGTIADR